MKVSSVWHLNCHIPLISDILKGNESGSEKTTLRDKIKHIRQALLGWEFSKCLIHQLFANDIVFFLKFTKGTWLKICLTKLKGNLAQYGFVTLCLW